jgi:hypothetical protein
MKRLRVADAILDAIDDVRRMGSDFDGGPRITVCFKTVSGEIFGHMAFTSFEQVNELAGRLRKRGYEMSMLHPQSTGCDFVFEDLTPSGADGSGGPASPAP